MFKASRRAFAAVVSGLLLTVSASVASPAEAATAPSEVTVIPSDEIADRSAHEIWFAGRAGFLHRRTSTSPWLWTTYANGATTVIDEIAGLSSSSVIPAGDDTVEFAVAVPGHDFSPTTRTALDLGTMTWRQHTLPGSGYLTRLLGGYRVVLRNTAPLVREVWALAEDGGHRATPITGIPEGTTSVSVRGGDATAALLALSTPDGNRVGLLDLESGRVTVLPGATTASQALLSSDRVGTVTGTTVRTWSRSAPLETPATVTLPSSPTGFSVGLAGDDVVVGPSYTMSGKAPVLRYPTDGRAPSTLVPAGVYMTAQARDGVLFVGGGETGSWSVRKATASGQSVIAPSGRPARNAGVTLTAGRLRHVQAYAAEGETASPEYRLFTHAITGPAETTADGGPLRTPVLTCQSDRQCVRTVDGYGGRSTYLAAGSGEVTVYAMPNGTVNVETLPSAGGSIADVSSSWVLVNGTNPARLYVVPVGGVAPLVRPATGAALVDDILWSATGPGVIRAENLTTETVGVSVTTGSACTATEVQATARHLYWTCGTSGPAGVYDKVRKVNIPLPAAPYLLGDNYVVRHDAGGGLIRHDLTDGTLGEPVTLATFPRGDLADDRNVTWAVDKFGGDVAWVDAANAVHIVDPGVAPSPPAGLRSRGPSALHFDQPGEWLASVVLNRPIESATTTITEMRTGKVVATGSSGFSRYSASVSWGGHVAGRRATSGTYRWSIAGVAGGESRTLGTGTFTVMCGLPRLHSPECSGAPALLGIVRTRTEDEGHWLLSAPDRMTLFDFDKSETWTGVTAIVPYGDISQDYLNDLLIRRPDGSLRVYLGTGMAAFGSSKSLVIPGNWNPYDALIHTGDLDGDNQSDLVARNRDTGALFLFPGNGKGGFNAATKIEGGYKGYSRFVGAGDINNDGKADLMLQYDPTSTMYALYGNGNGTFQAGLKVVGTGWLGYNIVIGSGDLNEDGKNDLILRDTAGNLFRRLGTGQGTFGDRAQIGTGYQQYAGLY